MLSLLGLKRAGSAPSNRCLGLMAFRDAIALARFVRVGVPLVKVPSFDPITYLVDSRFPGLNGLEVEVRSFALTGDQQAETINFLKFPPLPPVEFKQNALLSLGLAAEIGQRTERRERDAATYRAELISASKDAIDANFR